MVFHLGALILALPRNNHGVMSVSHQNLLMKSDSNFARGIKRYISPLGLALFGCLWSVSYGWALPPDYATFGRTQKVSHTVNPANLLRIWVVYVEQGDGLLIQLPPRYNYDADPADGNSIKSERLDILIDGGVNPTTEVQRMSDFITALYGSDATIEYAVISHHDEDHVAGLTHLLDETSIGVQTIFHNGLASYAGGKRDFPTNKRPETPAVYDFSDGRLRRGMAFLENDGETMQAKYLVDDLTQLRARQGAQEFQGVYNRLADAVVHKTDPPVSAFVRLKEADGFIHAREAQLNRGVDLSGIQFEVLWPLDPCRKYGDWGETINGNSVTFRLKYGDFEMLLTGDQNEKSEEALLEHLGSNSGRLACDVAKVPHHGSSHALEAFFRAMNPVLGVASMGPAGFKSKPLHGSKGWQHPSTDVIRWLGGHHRVYCTEIHEKPFKWEELTSKAKHDAMREPSHILIETDGEWFRVVEIPDSRPDLIGSPPSVEQTRRGNGTQWILAK